MINFSSHQLLSMFRKSGLRRGSVFGAILVVALLAFEVFNYSTTDFALADLIGNLRFAGIRWATILAIAFCGIDFAGIARLFTPEKGPGEPKEVWYLFGAWLLAATMNAILTWWGVAIAILSHESLGGSVLDRETMLKVVPIFVAIMVWVIRVLIIGSFSVTGDRLFSQSPSTSHSHLTVQQRRVQPTPSTNPHPTQAAPLIPVSKPAPKPAQSAYTRPEPTYHPASMSGPNHTPVQARK